MALRAAQAAIGAVAIAMGAAAEIVREVAGLPEDDRPTPGQDRATLLAGAALGLASEAARTAAAFADAAVRASRPVVIAGSSVAAPLARIADDLLARWDATWQRERPDAEAMAGAVATEATRRGVDAVLDQLDLTAIVVDRVDLERVVAGLDVDEVARRIDVDAIVARMDVEALTARIDPNAIADRIDVERMIERTRPVGARARGDRADRPARDRSGPRPGRWRRTRCGGSGSGPRRPTTRSRASWTACWDAAVPGTAREPRPGRPDRGARLPGEPRRRREPRPRQRDRPGRRRAPDRGPLRGLGRVRVPAPRPLVHVKLAHDFAEKEIRPVAWEYDRDATWPQEIITRPGSSG